MACIFDEACIIIKYDVGCIQRNELPVKKNILATLYDETDNITTTDELKLTRAIEVNTYELTWYGLNENHEYQVGFDNYLSDSINPTVYIGYKEFTDCQPNKLYIPLMRSDE